MTLGWCNSVEIAVFGWVRVADRNLLSFRKGSNCRQCSDFTPIEIASVESRRVTDPSLGLPRYNVDFRICGSFRKICSSWDRSSDFWSLKIFGWQFFIFPISEQIVESWRIRNMMDDTLDVEIDSATIMNSFASSIIVHKKHWLMISVQSSWKRCVVVRSSEGYCTYNSHAYESRYSSLSNVEWRSLLYMSEQMLFGPVVVNVHLEIIYKYLKEA